MSWTAPAGAQTPPIGVVDGLALATPTSSTATVSGWAFHPGGAAILRYRTAIDCSPNSSSICPALTSVLITPRPDVVAAYPSLPVPDNSGWSVTVLWSALPAGVHWIYAEVADAAGGRDAWTPLLPACFVKVVDSAGLSSVAPCDSTMMTARRRMR